MKGVIFHCVPERAQKLLHRLGQKLEDFDILTSRQLMASYLSRHQPNVVLLDWHGFGIQAVQTIFIHSPETLIMVIDSVPDWLVPQGKSPDRVVPVFNRHRWQKISAARKSEPAGVGGA